MLPVWSSKNREAYFTINTKLLLLFFKEVNRRHSAKHSRLKSIDKQIFSLRTRNQYKLMLFLTLKLDV